MEKEIILPLLHLKVKHLYSVTMSSVHQWKQFKFELNNKQSSVFWVMGKRSLLTSFWPTMSINSLASFMYIFCQMPVFLWMVTNQSLIHVCFSSYRRQQIRVYPSNDKASKPGILNAAFLFVCRLHFLNFDFFFFFSLTSVLSKKPKVSFNACCFTQPDHSFSLL